MGPLAASVAAVARIAAGRAGQRLAADLAGAILPVVMLPLDLVTRAGPRVAEALETIGVALHPEAFR